MRTTLMLFFCLCLSLILFGCGTVGSVTFPEPSPGFQPKKEHSLSFDDLWRKVRSVLETERINVASSDKEEGRITTDYIQGATQMMGIFGSITTRYKYSLSFDKSQQATSGLRIICTLESSSSKVPWHDVSKDNTERVTKLENWLHERIEK